MKPLYTVGLILAFLTCSSAGFSQNSTPVQNQPQNQNQSQPQNPQSLGKPQLQPQNQNQSQSQNSQGPGKPQLQPQTTNRNQTTAQPPQSLNQPPQRPNLNQPQSQPQSRSSSTPQNRTPRLRPGEKAQPTDNSTLTERAKIKNELESKAPEHVVWLREMYRSIDLEKENNAALYYPEQPIGDRMSLFATIFKLMASKKITAYNYVVNRQEVFIDSEKVDFEKILKTYQILYKKQGSGDNVQYIVDNSDIPSSEVLQYYIKEGWYFDAATGAYKSQVLAICPILVRKDYNVGDITNNGLFWIPYENLRPYLSRAMIMTSNYNNVPTYSIDDFFTKGMYKGDIIKTINLKDQSLLQQVGSDPEKLKHAQDSIENQLKTFKNQLWVQQDSSQIAANKSGKKASIKRESAGSTKKESAPKEQKPKAPKPEKTSTAPTKSVRKTR